MPRAAPANIRSLARQHTTLAVNTLMRVMIQSKNDNARVNAAIEMLKRGWGAVKADDERDGTLQITIRNIFERDPTLIAFNAKHPVNGNGSVIEHNEEEG